MTKSLIRYHVIFTSALIGLTVILGVINSFLDSGGLTGVSAVTPFLAATFAAHSFLNRAACCVSGQKNWGSAKIKRMFLNNRFVRFGLARDGDSDSPPTTPHTPIPPARRGRLWRFALSERRSGRRKADCAPALRAFGYDAVHAPGA